MSGSTTFCLTLYLTNLAGRVARIINSPVNLSTVSTEYKFTNIFSKTKAEILALNHLYNLQIKLKDREKLLTRTIYSLSATEQEALKKFISENFSTRFIYDWLPPLMGH